MSYSTTHDAKKVADEFCAISSRLLALRDLARISHVQIHGMCTARRAAHAARRRPARDTDRGQTETRDETARHTLTSRLTGPARPELRALPPSTAHRRAHCSHGHAARPFHLTTPQSLQLFRNRNLANMIAQDATPTGEAIGRPVCCGLPPQRRGAGAERELAGQV